jgi:hypothetical protein
MAWKSMAKTGKRKRLGRFPRRYPDGKRVSKTVLKLAKKHGFS